MTPPATKLERGGDGVVCVRLEATNRSFRKSVYAPRFPKARMSGGWWLAMGEEDELLALRRFVRDRVRVKVGHGRGGGAASATPVS